MVWMAPSNGMGMCQGGFDYILPKEAIYGKAFRDRPRSGQECLSGSWRQRDWDGGVPSPVATGTASAVFLALGALSGWHGSLRRSASLGAGERRVAA